nr:hypothetical protein CFP56_03242 [Quercus suber]
MRPSSKLLSQRWRCLRVHCHSSTRANMDSSNSRTKPDRWLSPFQKLVSSPPNAGAVSRPALVLPITPSSKTNDPILLDVLRLLTEIERSVIQGHVASDISTTIQAAYDAAETQKDV